MSNAAVLCKIVHCFLRNVLSFSRISFSNLFLFDGKNFLSNWRNNFPKAGNKIFMPLKLCLVMLRKQNITHKRCIQVLNKLKISIVERNIVVFYFVMLYIICTFAAANLWPLPDIYR